jgi:hypothetical protein
MSVRSSIFVLFHVLALNYEHLRLSAISSPPQEREQRIFEELLSKYEKASRTAAELKALVVTPRKPLLGKWLREGDLGFVYGERGSGKTWLVEAIAISVSTGTDLHGWEAPEKAVGVYIIDGEMPLDDSCARAKGLGASAPVRNMEPTPSCCRNTLFSVCNRATTQKKSLQMKPPTRSPRPPFLSLVNLNDVMARAGLFAIRQPEKPTPMSTPTITKSPEPHHPKRSNAERILDAIYSIPEDDIQFEDFVGKLIREGKSDLACHILILKRLDEIRDALQALKPKA